jgi:uncharacterized protein (TIGR02001 family)
LPISSFAAELGGSLGISSAYVRRGVSLSDRAPSLQGDVHGYTLSGWFGGLSAASVKLDSPKPMTAEISAYGGYTRSLATDWQLQLEATHYDYPGSALRHYYVYDELVSRLTFRDRLGLIVAASPDTSIYSDRGNSNGRPAFAYELDGSLPLPYSFSADGGIGYRDLHRLVGVGYVYWNAGVAWDLGRASLGLNYIGTNATAKSLFGDAEARNRWVVALTGHF